MKVAIYIRVSRRDLEPENQKFQLIEHTKKMGWDYEIFEEQESTRKTRPIKEKVLSLIRKGKFDGVLIYKLDRWARSLQELIMNVREITDRKKQFIVLTQPIDTTSSSGMLMLQILGAFAEFEREIIRERTLSGLERARRQGKKLGRPKGQSLYNIPTEDAVSMLLGQGKTDREIAKLLGASRYMVQKAIESIKKNNMPKKGGDLFK